MPYIATTKPSTKPRVSATGMSISSGDELSLRHLQWETQRRCRITGTSITVDELHEQGHRPHCPRTATAETPQFSVLT